MGQVLNQPFVSESYDRLMAAQAQHKAASALLDERMTPHVLTLLEKPVTDIRAVRNGMGLSQAAFGELIGIDGPRLSGFENGKPLPKYVDLAARCLLALEAAK